MSEKRLIITNTLANGVAQFAGIVAGFLLMPWLVRSFGVTNYGLYMLAQSVVAYATVLDLGVGASLVKLVAEKASVRDGKQVSRLASTTLLFYLIIGAAVASFVAVVAFNTSAIFRVDADGARLLRNLLLVAAMTGLFTWPLNTASYLLQGFQRYTTTARTSVLIVLGNLAGTLAVVVTGQGPFVLMIVLACVSIGGGILNAIASRDLLERGSVRPWLAERAVFRQVFGLSWAVFVVQICTLVIYQQTDRLILGVFIGAAAVTLYEVAGKFQQLVVQLTAFTNSALLPLASSMGAESRESSLRTLFLRGTKYTLAMVTPIVTVLVVLARPLILKWMGPAFAVEAIAAQVFLSHQLLTPGTAVGDTIIVGLGKLKKRVPYVVGILTVGNVVIALALVRQFGVMAVVLGTAIPHLIDYPLHMRFLLREIKVPTERFWREVALPVYPLLLVPLALAVAFTYSPFMDSLAGVVSAGVVSVSAYWIALAAFALSPVEKAELAGLVERLRLRLSA